MTIQLMPLYTRGENVDDRQLYLMTVLWLYSHALMHVPCQECLGRWWEASLN